MSWQTNGSSIISIINQKKCKWSLIKKQIHEVKIPSQNNKIKFSFILLTPFIFVAIFVAGVNDSSFGALFPAFMINEFFSDRQIGLYFFIGAFVGVLTQPIVGALSDKIDKNIVIAAHGNSIRALCKYLFKINENDISKLEIPTGNPLLIEFEKGIVKNARYLDKERAQDLINF